MTKSFEGIIDMDIRRSTRDLAAFLEKKSAPRRPHLFPVAHDLGRAPMRSQLVDGVKHSPLAGVSMRYTFDDAKAPVAKETRYYEMLGTRGITSRSSATGRTTS